MDDFEKEIKAGFLEEASQLMADTEKCFLQLESEPQNPELLEQIFRLAHNLKGSAKAVGFDQLGAFTHELESYLLKLKKKEIAVESGAISLLLACNDHVLKMIQALSRDYLAQTDGSDLLAQIHEQMAGAGHAAPAPAPAPDEGGGGEGVQDQAQAGSDLGVALRSDPPTISSPLAEVALPQELKDLQAEVVMQEFLSDFDQEDDDNEASTIEELALEATAQLFIAAQENATVWQPNASAATTTPKESGVSAPVSAPTPTSSSGVAPQVRAEASGQKAAAPSPAAAPVDESIRVSLARLEKLMNFVGEMVILQTVLREQMQLQSSNLLRKTVHQLGKVTKEVQDISMSLRMVPLKQTFQKMQRIVRDTSATLHKKVNLVIEGEETELDKTVLENLGDPLVHLIRNGVDHGIESSEIRQALGKPAVGTLWLKAFHQSGSLIIELRDDGAGLNPEKLKSKAIEKGILKPNAQLTSEEAYQLIFAAGFSTKEVVTDVSGRGVGMDVVKTNIEKLQGQILITTELGRYTCFTVKLPLTLAIIDAMVILVEKERFVVPLSHVHESLRPKAEELNFVTGIGHMLCLRGESLPLYFLSTLLGKKPSKPASECIAIVCRHARAAPFSVLVDDILGQHQVVIKKLGQEHQQLKGFSGSAILGDGKPSLILELLELAARFKPSLPSLSNAKRPTAPSSTSSSSEQLRKVIHA